jgi:hypothetical protein
MTLLSGSVNSGESCDGGDQLQRPNLPEQYAKSAFLGCGPPSVKSSYKFCFVGPGSFATDVKKTGASRACDGSHGCQTQKCLDQRLCHGALSQSTLLQNKFAGFARVCHQLPNAAARWLFSPIITQELLPWKWRVVLLPCSPQLPQNALERVIRSRVVLHKPSDQLIMLLVERVLVLLLPRRSVAIFCLGTWTTAPILCLYPLSSASMPKFACANCRLLLFERVNESAGFILDHRNACIERRSMEGLESNQAFLKAKLGTKVSQQFENVQVSP